MMSKHIFTGHRVLAVSFYFVCLLLFAMPAIALDGNAILMQVDRNLQPESYEMYRKLINIEPDGDKKEFVLYTVKKGLDRMVGFVVYLQRSLSTF